MKSTIIFTLLSICALLQLSGCSQARYPIADISKNTSLVHLDVNDLRNKHLFDETTEALKLINAKIDFGANKTFSVKYYRSAAYNAPHVAILVEFPNGRKYPALLDTGFNASIALTSDVVLDNKLAIMPVGPHLKSNLSGICYIPVLNIGPARIKDAIALYEEQQWQFRILNIPIFKLTAIILGRDLIKSFDYVMFDNIHKEAVFSKEGAFEPDNPQLWSSYTFFEDPNALNTIVVQIPIAGQLLKVPFDSCGGGLIVNKNQWQIIKQNLMVKRLVKSSGTIYSGKTFPLQKATVSELSIADKNIKNTELLIDNNPEPLSQFGLSYFQDTVVVLDYVNNLMWIKKT